jgi:RNA polymerase sigma factor (sigma-70 family)
MPDTALRRLLGYVRRRADADGGPASDAGLLERFATRGDEAAFELLVWRHGGLVLGVCRRVLGDAHAAEDAFQATFLALARQAGSVRRREALAGWLHRVARRIAGRARAQAARRVVHERRAAVGLAVTPDDRMSGDVRAVIDEELDRLPAKLRSAVVLCYLEGLTTEEAARRLGCPRGTVLSRLAAARDRLRGQLVRRGLALPAGGLAALLAPAEATAGLVAPAVRAAVAYAAGTAAAAGVASPQVIGWADGAIRAMTLSKLTTTAGAVLAVGMMGLGGAWVAGPGGRPAAAFAEGPQQQADERAPGAVAEQPQDDRAEQRRREIEESKRRAEEAERAEQRRRAELRDMLVQTEVEIRQQEEALLERERRALRDVIEARLKFMAAEDRLKQLQRQHERLPDDSTVVAALKNSVAEDELQLQEREQKLGSDHPDTQSARQRLKAHREQLDLAMRGSADRPRQLEQDLAKARREFVEAETEYRVSEQRAALEKQRQQRRLEVLDQHWREVAGQARRAPQPRADDRDRLADLERKLDELLREVRDLRREGRR